MCRSHRALSTRHLVPVFALAGSFVANLPLLAGPSYGGVTNQGNFALPSPFAQHGRSGYALASGDFDGDGRMDLAVGAPNDTTNGNSAGRVDLYLAPAGELQLVGHYYGAALTNTGWALAAGDFDNDGKDELAVGCVSATLSGAAGAGKVIVLGWNAGTSQLVFRQELFQGMSLVGETPETNDGFGRVLAVGDFNADMHDDLAVGVPFEDLTGGTNQGVVHVFYGFDSGLITLGSQNWNQDAPFVDGQVDDVDTFGWSLATGDFNGDGRDDLAIGIPNEPNGNVQHAGGVAVIYGINSSGLGPSGNHRLLEGVSGIPGTPEESDGFGTAVAAGYFNTGGRADLAIGAPGDNILGVDSAGSVFELYGTATGVSGTGSKRWALDDLGLPLLPESFGTILAVGNFDGDARHDLVVGSPYNLGNGLTTSGMVDVLPGGATGLSAARHTHWTAAGLATGPPKPGDQFGFAVAAGDVDGNGLDDLFLGLPGRAVGTPPVTAGAVQVLRGRPGIFTDDFENGTANGWSVGP